MWERNREKEKTKELASGRILLCFVTWWKSKTFYLGTKSSGGMQNFCLTLKHIHLEIICWNNNLQRSNEEAFDMSNTTNGYVAYISYIGKNSCSFSLFSLISFYHIWWNVNSINCYFSVSFMLHYETLNSIHHT